MDIQQYISTVQIYLGGGPCAAPSSTVAEDHCFHPTSSTTTLKRPIEPLISKFRQCCSENHDPVCTMP